MADRWGQIDNDLSGGADVWDDGLAGALLLADYFTSAQDIYPSLLAGTNDFYSAAISQTGGVQALEPALFANSQTFPAATVAATYNLSAPLLSGSQTFPAASVVATYSLAPALFTNAQTFPAATVAATYALTAPLITGGQTFYAASVAAAYSLAVPLIASGTEFFGATVTVVIDQVLTASLVENENTFPVASIRAYRRPTASRPGIGASQRAVSIGVARPSHVASTRTNANNVSRPRAVSSGRR